LSNYSGAEWKGSLISGNVVHRLWCGRNAAARTCFLYKGRLLTFHIVQIN